MFIKYMFFFEKNPSILVKTNIWYVYMVFNCICKHWIKMIKPVIRCSDVFGMRVLKWVVVTLESNKIAIEEHPL